MSVIRKKTELTTTLASYSLLKELELFAKWNDTNATWWAFAYQFR